jgi:hypothetical protein
MTPTYEQRFRRFSELRQVPIEEREGELVMTLSPILAPEYAHKAYGAGLRLEQRRAGTRVEFVYRPTMESPDWVSPSRRRNRKNEPKKESTEVNQLQKKAQEPQN